MTWPIAVLTSVALICAASLVAWLAYLRLERAQRVTERLDQVEEKVQKLWNALALRQQLTSVQSEQRVK